MLTLVVLRHAKAEAFSEHGDAARVLTKRGLAQAAQVGQLLADRVGVPDLVLSSDARRASQTAVLAAEAMRASHNLELSPQIYAAEPEKLMSLIQSIDPSVKTAVIVGHNPGMEWLAQMLSGNESVATVLHPASAAILESSEENWQNISAGVFGLKELIDSHVD